MRRSAQYPKELVARKSAENHILRTLALATTLMLGDAKGHRALVQSLMTSSHLGIGRGEAESGDR